MKKSTKNSPHYFWGAQCEGWRLVDNTTLAVIEERMPVGTREVLHWHEKAQQFFYILEGVAQFELEGDILELTANEGIPILQNQKHFISNIGETTLRFLVISQPNTKRDRIEIKTD